MLIPLFFSWDPVRVSKMKSVPDHGPLKEVPYAWILQERSEGIVLINEYLRTEALEIATDLNIGEQFEASNKWI